MRRRRRRRSGGGFSPRLWQIGGGVAALVLIGGFFFFLNAADKAVPTREEVRIALPDAFSDRSAEPAGEEANP